MWVYFLIFLAILLIITLNNPYTNIVGEEHFTVKEKGKALDEINKLKNLLGGQTITGYQKGRLEMAWENVDEDGNKFDGAVLLLDELPKLDPNTAGILNEALASIKDFKGDNPPTIRNGKGVTGPISRL